MGEKPELEGETIGIDLGTTYSCVGVWQDNNVEIIANDQGNRTTPSWVAFNENEKLVGESAKNQYNSNPENTLFDVKRFMGQKFQDTNVQNEMKHMPYKVVSGKNNNPTLRVKYKNEIVDFVNSIQLQLDDLEHTKTYGYEFITVRPANNYGIFQQPEKLIPFSVANILSGNSIEIYGKGNNIRHWLHVDDTCSAIDHLIEKGKINEVYNIGSGFYLSNIELARKLLMILDKQEDMIEFVEDRPGHDFRYAVNLG